MDALEFFAGIGHARMGLARAGIRTVWSNDVSERKTLMHRLLHPDGPAPVCADIRTLRPDDLPSAQVAWASSPCTDLSVAGARAGLNGRESGMFHELIRLLDGMGARRPRAVILENVTGLASSHDGKDMRAAIGAFNRLGYSVDPIMVDALRFTPQSRPRLFLTCLLDPPAMEDRGAHPCRPSMLDRFHDDPHLRTHRLPLPPSPPLLAGGFGRVAEPLADDDPHWWDACRTARLTGTHRARLGRLRAVGGDAYRCACRRTRPRGCVWEMRADDTAGCLRTPRGGSSRQAVIHVDRAGRVRARWMLPVECARLMGAPTPLPAGAGDTDWLMGFGDAVCVPAAAWVARHTIRTEGKDKE